MAWMILPLKRYAQFSGRSRRKEYWMFVLFTVLVNLGFVALMFAAGGASIFAAMSSPDPTTMMTGAGLVGIIYGLSLLFSLAILIPGLAVHVRRLHDTDRSGWWLLTPIVPYFGILIFSVGSVYLVDGGLGENAAFSLGIGVLLCSLAWMVLSIVLLVFMCLDGTSGPNRFGADPKQSSGDLESVFS
jgi:uncharacterized membrane protein YhaH (DUF805 family)